MNPYVVLAVFVLGALSFLPEQLTKSPREKFLKHRRRPETPIENEFPPEQRAIVSAAMGELAGFLGIRRRFLRCIGLEDVVWELYKAFPTVPTWREIEPHDLWFFLERRFPGASSELPQHATVRQMLEACLRQRGRLPNQQ